MTFIRPSAPRKRVRWFGMLAVLSVLALTAALFATSAQAAPSFTFVGDVQGADDEPGQKDLTAQSSAFDSVSPFHFFTAWKWDVLKLNGGNTGDACSLFDTGTADGLANFAVCVTIAGDPASESSTRVYSCNNTRAERCAGATLVGTEGINSSANWCTVTNPASGQFDASDTQATCDITQVDADLAAIGPLGSTQLLNSCSYPSQEPGSDPSDCVVTITNVNTSLTTLSSGTTTWSATLNDTAQLSPTTATGSVVFKLWGVNTAGVCSTLVWQSAAVTVGAGGTATTVGAGTTSGSNIITNTTTDADKVFYWTVDYTPTGAFNASSSACGEATTITPASVAGAAG
jgi:hypothetical protein